MFLGKAASWNRYDYFKEEEMAHTEKEAGTKRCCGSSGVRCQASDCMGWRWHSVKGEFGQRVQEFVKTDEPWVCEYCHGEGCAECDGAGKGFKSAPTGFCGLAGAPT